MYFPYFRGKQYELIAIRETAALLQELGFVPIIGIVPGGPAPSRNCCDVLLGVYL